MKNFKMKAFVSASALFTIALHTAAFAATETSITCMANDRISNAGGGRVAATGQLTFIETSNARGAKVLKNIQGQITIHSAERGGRHVGNFNIRSLTESSDYRPTKYEGYSQFKNFDAADVTNEFGEYMAGNFVLEGDARKTLFQGVYMFKVGDHFGSTLRFKCQATE